MSGRVCLTERFAGALLVALALVIYAPLFLRAPLGPDPVMYDLQTQVVQDGGVLYRDILEPNLPGAVWLHLAARSLAGWSSEVLRAFDLGLYCISVRLLGRLVPLSGVSRALFAAVLIAGYTTLSEWCHCQRDVWMLPFVLGAMLLRVNASENRRIPPVAMAVMEGTLWGAAVWLKPHVLVPAACVAALSVLLTMRCGQSMRARLVREGGVLVGGAIVGLAGVAWLLAHDAWRPLWVVLTDWNRDYVAASASRWSWGRLWSIQERLAPWSLVHVVAAPAAVWSLWRVIATPREDLETEIRRGLFSALYLGWIAQTLLLQHLFDYVHTPALVLGAAVAVLSIRVRSTLQWSPQRMALAGIAVLVPALVVRGDQLRWWSQCIHAPATPAMHAGLSRLPLPEWNQLAQVAAFLRAQGVRDGELTAYHTHTIHLYPALQVRPSTRFVFTETHLRLFPSRAKEIADALRSSRQRFVVSDLLAAGMSPREALDDSDREGWRSACPGDALAAFPFDQPVVFRAGPYLVHEVTGPVGPVETGFFPLAAKSAGL